MIFEELPLKGAFLIRLEKHADQRGFFSRTFCQKEFSQAQIGFEICQSNLSFNQYEKTLRGMHFQAAPYQEPKLVQCLRGAIFDVVIDLRPKSDSFGHWWGTELNEANLNLLYIPKDFAHGFMTLKNETLIQYHMGQYYQPKAAKGILWNSPEIGVEWPCEPLHILEKDQLLPRFKKAFEL